MNDYLVSCSQCGSKLKLKAGRAIPADAACPKCQAPLSADLPKTVAAPAKPITTKPASTGVPTAKKMSDVKKSQKSEVAEDDFEEEYEPLPVRSAPRGKPARSRSKSSGGISSWLVGVLCGLCVVVIGGGAFIAFRSGGGSDSGATSTTSIASNDAINPSVSPAADGTSTVASPSTAAVSPPLTSSSAVVPTSTAPIAASQPSPQPPVAITPVQSPSVQAPTQPVPASPATPAPATSNIAKYHPLPESKHNYNFEATATFDKYSEKSSGQCLMAMEKKVESGFSVRSTKPEQGTGSGIVLTPDGVIATCAHVVNDTTSIEVVIGGQTYPAKVLHLDIPIDLALLKIEAQGLNPVTLANSDQLQLGQALRVVGFPLSDVLGTGIKITQGAVSGILEQDGQRRIQTDATINPGNSGGPVFNTRGEVVGIASAKLSGVAVSQVGFCVPSNTLAALIQKHGVGLPPAIPGQEMDATALVQKVTPSVAYIKVSGDAPAEPAFTFRYTANMRVRRQTLDGHPIIGGITLPTRDRGYVSMSDNGTPVDISDGEYAPIIMSRLPLIPFVELSRTGQPDWTKQREISIVREERSKSPFGSRRGFYDDLFPGQKPKVIAVQKAMEIEKFHVTSDTAEQLVLNRTYELKTTDGSEPGLLLTGSGTWTFDRTTGMPAASETKGTYQVTVSGVTITIPYTVNVSRMSPNESDEVDEQMAAIPNGSSVEKPGQDEASNNQSASGDATFVIQSKSWGYKTVAISPDNKNTAFTNQEKTIFIHNLETGKEVDSKVGLNGIGTPSQSIYSPDGKYLLVGGQEGVIRVWSVDDKGEIDHLGDFVGHTSNIESMKILDDNRTVISSDQKNNVHAWTLDDRKDKYSIPDLKEQIVEIGISADKKSGYLVATSSMVTTFNLTDGKVTSSAPVFKSHFGKVAHFTSDGKTLFISDTYKVTCHKVNSKKSPDAIDVGESIWDIDYCEKTHEILAAGNGKIHIIDFKEETRTGILNTGSKITGYVKNIAISSDGLYVVAIGGPIGQSVLIFDRHAKKSNETPSKNDSSTRENEAPNEP